MNFVWTYSNPILVPYHVLHGLINPDLVLIQMIRHQSTSPDYFVRNYSTPIHPFILFKLLKPNLVLIQIISHLSTSPDRAVKSLESFSCWSSFGLGSASPRVVPHVLEANDSSPASLMDGKTMDTPATPSGSDSWFQRLLNYIKTVK